MTLKLTMIGALLFGGLIATARPAKAEVGGGYARPPAAAYVQTAPRRDAWMRHGRHYRPVAVVPVANHRYGYVPARTQNASVVAMEIRAQMDRATADLRFDVRQGVVEPRALASLDADRAEIERDLVAASAKGYFTPQDRLHLEQHVQEIRDLRTQFRCARPSAVTYRR